MHNGKEILQEHISVNYRSEIDSISIIHEAHSRDGFALGAVIAAEWIISKKRCF